MVKIAPSMLAADFAKLGDEIEKITQAGADWIHWDVMDGHFVPNISFGAPVIKALRPKTDLCFDVHLMIDPVDALIPDFIDAGADRISVHVEASLHLDRTLSLIRSYGKKAGAVLNPATSLASLEYVMDKLDLVLLMSVNPGFGGQKYIPAITEKIKQLYDMRQEKQANFLIQVDGGISNSNAAEIINAGADVLVAGSAIFSQADYQTAIKALRN